MKKTAVKKSTVIPRDELVLSAEFFALGTDAATDRHYASFPVTIGSGDGTEFYFVDDATFAAWIADPALARPFVQAARNHEHDDLLMEKLPRHRGTPW